MLRKQKKVENDTQTLYDLEYGKKTYKRGKWESQMLGLEILQETLKIVQN
jgi:hypothetical protein